MLLCLDNLQKNISVPQSMIMSMKIFQDLDDYSDSFISLNSVITQLEQQIGLIDLIIKNIRTYFEIVS